MIRDVAMEVQRALGAVGIPSLIRKGIVYQHLAYRRPGVRHFGDMDMFIPIASAKPARGVFEHLGFFHGAYAHGTHNLERWGRREAILYRLFPDHLPRYVRIHDDPFVRVVFVDIATELAWHGSSYTEALRGFLEEQFQSPSTVEGMQTMGLVGHFIDCVLHLYREASFETHIRAGYDVSLRKFLDVLVLWSKLDTSGRAEVKAVIETYGIALPVAWVTHHLDALFDSEVSASLGLEGRLSERELQTWYSDNSKPGQWHGTMRQRLFASDRLPLFEPTSVKA